MAKPLPCFSIPCISQFACKPPLSCTLMGSTLGCVCNAWKTRLKVSHCGDVHILSSTCDTFCMSRWTKDWQTWWQLAFNVGVGVKWPWASGSAGIKEEECLVN